jgi:hypothetical protein
MKTLIFTPILLMGFFLFLSINIKQKPIFSYIYEVISPATKAAQNATEDFFSKSLSSTKTYSKKLFDNSVPKVRDSVKSKMSATQKTVSEPLEKITDIDKRELDQLIKNH